GSRGGDGYRRPDLGGTWCEPGSGLHGKRRVDDRVRRVRGTADRVAEAGAEDRVERNPWVPGVGALRIAAAGGQCVVGHEVSGLGTGDGLGRIEVLPVHVRDEAALVGEVDRNTISGAVPL